MIGFRSLEIDRRLGARKRQAGWSGTGLSRSWSGRGRRYVVIERERLSAELRRGLGWVPEAAMVMGWRGADSRSIRSISYHRNRNQAVTD